MLPVSRQHVSLCIQQQTGNRLATILLMATSNMLPATCCPGVNAVLTVPINDTAARNYRSLGKLISLLVTLGLGRSNVWWFSKTFVTGEAGKVAPLVYFPLTCTDPTVSLCSLWLSCKCCACCSTLSVNTQFWRTQPTTTKSDSVICTLPPASVAYIISCFFNRPWPLTIDYKHTYRPKATICHNAHT